MLVAHLAAETAVPANNGPTPATEVELLLLQARFAIPAICNYLYFRACHVAVVYLGKSRSAGGQKRGIPEAVDMKTKLLRLLQRDIWPPLRADVPDESWITPAHVADEEGAAANDPMPPLPMPPPSVGGDGGGVGGGQLGRSATAPTPPPFQADGGGPGSSSAVPHQPPSITTPAATSPSLEAVLLRNDSSLDYVQDGDAMVPASPAPAAPPPLPGKALLVKPSLRPSGPGALGRNMQALVYLKAASDGTHYVKLVLSNIRRVYFDVVDATQEKYRWDNRKLYIRVLDNLETQSAIVSYDEYEKEFRDACRFAVRHPDPVAEELARLKDELLGPEGVDGGADDDEAEAGDKATTALADESTAGSDVPSSSSFSQRSTSASALNASSLSDVDLYRSMVLNGGPSEELAVHASTRAYCLALQRYVMASTAAAPSALAAHRSAALLDPIDVGPSPQQHMALNAITGGDSAASCSAVVTMSQQPTLRVGALDVPAGLLPQLVSSAAVMSSLPAAAVTSSRVPSITVRYANRAVPFCQRMDAPESATLDYKSYFANTVSEVNRKAATFLCGFANALGKGRLVIGVHELKASSSSAAVAAAHAAQLPSSAAIITSVAGPNRSDMEQIVIGSRVTAVDVERMRAVLTEQLMLCVPPIPPHCVWLTVVPVEFAVHCDNFTEACPILIGSERDAPDVTMPVPGDAPAGTMRGGPPPVVGSTTLFVATESPTTTMFVSGGPAAGADDNKPPVDCDGAPRSHSAFQDGLADSSTKPAVPVVTMTAAAWLPLTLLIHEPSKGNWRNTFKEKSNYAIRFLARLGLSLCPMADVDWQTVAVHGERRPEITSSRPANNFSISRVGGGGGRGGGKGSGHKNNTSLSSSSRSESTDLTRSVVDGSTLGLVASGSSGHQSAPIGNAPASIASTTTSLRLHHHPPGVPDDHVWQLFMILPFSIPPPASSGAAAASLSGSSTCAPPSALWKAVRQTTAAAAVPGACTTEFPSWTATILSELCFGQRHRANQAFLALTGLAAPSLAMLDISIDFGRLSDDDPLLQYRGKFFSGWPSIPLWNLELHRVTRVRRDLTVFTDPKRRLFHATSQSHGSDRGGHHRGAEARGGTSTALLQTPPLGPMASSASHNRRLSRSHSPPTMVVAGWHTEPRTASAVFSFLGGACRLHFRSINRQCNGAFEAAEERDHILAIAERFGEPLTGFAASFSAVRTVQQALQRCAQMTHPPSLAAALLASSAAAKLLRCASLKTSASRRMSAPLPPDAAAAGLLASSSSVMMPRRLSAEGGVAAGSFEADTDVAGMPEAITPAASRPPPPQERRGTAMAAVDCGPRLMPLLLCWVYESLGHLPAPFPFICVPLQLQASVRAAFLPEMIPLYLSCTSGVWGIVPHVFLDPRDGTIKLAIIPGAAWSGGWSSHHPASVAAVPSFRPMCGVMLDAFQPKPGDLGTPSKQAQLSASSLGRVSSARAPISGGAAPRALQGVGPFATRSTAAKKSTARFVFVDDTVGLSSTPWTLKHLLAWLRVVASDPHVRLQSPLAPSTSPSLLALDVASAAGGPLATGGGLSFAFLFDPITDACVAHLTQAQLSSTYSESSRTGSSNLLHSPTTAGTGFWASHPVDGGGATASAEGPHHPAAAAGRPLSRTSPFAYPTSLPTRAAAAAAGNLSTAFAAAGSDHLGGGGLQSPTTSSQWPGCFDCQLHRAETSWVVW